MSSIEEQIKALGPWISGFEVNGTRYGGSYLPERDSRVHRFVDEFRKWRGHLGRGEGEPLRILECGCLEGGHTAILAKSFPRAQIVAVDARPENLRKTELFLGLRGISSARLVQDDFDDAHTAFSETYDAIFC
jgi:tRNA G46 methylase TrmB